jgi:hypothetical protein
MHSSQALKLSTFLHVWTVPLEAEQVIKGALSDLLLSAALSGAVFAGAIDKIAGAGTANEK